MMDDDEMLITTQLTTPCEEVLQSCVGALSMVEEIGSEGRTFHSITRTLCTDTQDANPEFAREG